MPSTCLCGFHVAKKSVYIPLGNRLIYRYRKRRTVWRLGLEAMILDFDFIEEKMAESVAKLVEIARDECYEVDEDDFRVPVFSRIFDLESEDDYDFDEVGRAMRDEVFPKLTGRGEKRSATVSWRFESRTVKSPHSTTMRLCMAARATVKSTRRTSLTTGLRTTLSLPSSMSSAVSDLVCPPFAPSSYTDGGAFFCFRFPCRFALLVYLFFSFRPAC